MADSIKPGTRVRVTYEGKVLDSTDFGVVLIAVGDRWRVYAPQAAIEPLPPEEPEVVKRARELAVRLEWRQPLDDLADAFMALLAEQEEK